MKWDMENKAIIKINILGIYQILGGLIGIGLTIYIAKNVIKFQLPVLILFSIALLLYSFSVFCGFLLFKKPILGLRYSKLNQLLQLVSFSVSGYSFKYISGLYLSFTLNLLNLTSFKLDFGTSSWLITFNQYSDIQIITINLFSLLLIIFIDKQKTKLQNIEAENQVSKIGESE